MKLSEKQKVSILYYHDRAISRGDFELHDVYGRYSDAKEYSFRAIKEEMRNLCGYSLAIISHNGFMYTCGFYYDTLNEETGEVETTRFRYYTRNGFSDFLVIDCTKKGV